MKRIAVVFAIATLVVLTSGCTQEQMAAWMAWRAEDPVGAAEYLAHPDVQHHLINDWDHDGLVEPDPTIPPPAPARERSTSSQAAPSQSSSVSSSGNSCTGLIGTLSAYSPGWDVNRMAQIAYRESRCQASASNSCCTGVLQIHQIWIPKAGECGVYSRADLTDPSKNVCVAAIIYRTQGIGAWSTA